MLSRALPLLIACLLCSPAGASVEPTLGRAKAQLRSLEYGEAIKTAKAVISLGRSGPTELAALYELLGEALASVGSGAEAKTYFRKLLALRPDYRAQQYFSPKIRRPLSRVISDWGGRPGLTIRHAAPRRARVDQPLTLKIGVVEDPARQVRGARIRYRLPGAGGESRVGGEGRAAIVIRLPLPAQDARPGSMEYVVELLDEHGNALVRKVGLKVELVGPVARSEATPTPWYSRWWVWTLAGAVVAGTATAAVLSTRAEDASRVRFDWTVKPLR